MPYDDPMDGDLDFKTRQCLGKKAFETYEDADVEAEKISVRHPTRVYQCGVCQKFHLASVDKKREMGWHKPCGGAVRVIYRAGVRYCGKCLKKMLELK